MQTGRSITLLTLLRSRSGSVRALNINPRGKVVFSRSGHQPRCVEAVSTRSMATQTNNVVHGDLNNTEVLRKTVALPPDPEYLRKSLAIPTEEDDRDVRAQLRPFLLPDEVTANDWVSKLELSTALKMAEADMQKTGGDRLKVVILYGSLRSRYVIVGLNEEFASITDSSGHTLVCWHSNVHGYCTALAATFVFIIRMACLSKTMSSITMPKFKSCES